MSDKMEQLYQERLRRYVTAMRNEKPDRVPIRPFVAEFTAKYAGYTCQEVTHDYEKAFAAARKCAADFDWDAVVSQHGLRLDRPDAGDRAEVLRRAGHRRPARRRLPVPRAAGGRGLHAGGRVRRADRRPDRLPVQRLAAARVGRRRRAGRARTRTATTCRSSRAAWRCCSTSTPSARRSPRLRTRVGHGLGHRRHPQGAVRHPRRQAARLRRPDAWTCSSSRTRCWRPARR